MLALDASEYCLGKLVICSENQSFFLIADTSFCTLSLSTSTYANHEKVLNSM
jgi:hypothetical protein